MGGRWWAEFCERRLMFVCEGGRWPPLLPSPPTPPPNPPLPPMPPHEPPAPPYAPAIALWHCCISYYRWAPPCCACNNFCRDTLIASAAVLVCALLPTCVYMARASRQHRERRRPSSSPSAITLPANAVMAGGGHELTAWPRAHVGPLHFACFQVGFFLTILGALPLILRTARMWSVQRAPRSLVMSLRQVFVCTFFVILQ